MSFFASRENIEDAVLNQDPLSVTFVATYNDALGQCYHQDVIVLCSLASCLSRWKWMSVAEPEPLLVPTVECGMEICLKTLPGCAYSNCGGPGKLTSRSQR